MSARERYGKIRAKTPARILTFDIETIPALVWQFSPRDQWTAPEKVEEEGYLASFAAKWYDQKQTEFYSTFEHGKDAVLENLWRLLDQADIVVGYNSDRFDIKRVRTELLRAGFGPFSPPKSVDLIKTIRSQFDFPYKRLDYVAQALGCGGKATHQGFTLWRDCAHNDPKAWKTMERYNRRDVVITERVYDRIRGYIPNHPNLGLFQGSETRVCPNCGNSEFRDAGTNRTAQTNYAQYQCRKCGKHVRANWIKQRLEYRAAR